MRVNKTQSYLSQRLRPAFACAGLAAQQVRRSLCGICSPPPPPPLLLLLLLMVVVDRQSELQRGAAVLLRHRCSRRWRRI